MRTKGCPLVHHTFNEQITMETHRFAEEEAVWRLWARGRCLRKVRSYGVVQLGSACGTCQSSKRVA